MLAVKDTLNSLRRWLIMLCNSTRTMALNYHGPSFSHHTEINMWLIMLNFVFVVPQKKCLALPFREIYVCLEALLPHLLNITR